MQYLQSAINNCISLIKKCVVIPLICIFIQRASAQTETITARSWIVDMGQTTQTFSNGLKPYGLIYELLSVYHVPVRWSINPSKSKDGTDFVHNSKSYRGGPFVIPFAYRSKSVDSAIAVWKAKGVVIDSTISSVVIPVNSILKSVPRFFFVLDKQNGAIAQGYLMNAEIPATAYAFIPPDSLTCCIDLFAMPHADPVWSTHKRLYTWMKPKDSGGCQGAIWAACHAVSALEDMFNPAAKWQQTNFLSTKTGTATGAGPWQENALLLWGNHNSGSTPYSYRYPSDPVMQFIGKTQAAQLNGSEQIYLPVKTGAWRSTTKIGSWDPTQADIPTKSNGEAALIAYGPAWGDTMAGRVMYEAGHSHNKGSAPDNVAAQRAFFNFAIWSQLHKSVLVAFVGNPPTSIRGTLTQTYSVSASGGSGSYTYKWTASVPGGTFSASSAATTNYVAPSVTANTNAFVSVTVKDACGRSAFYSFPIVILPSPRAPIAGNDAATISSGCGSGVQTAVINLLSNDSDPDGDPITTSIVTNPSNGSASIVNGILTYTPNSGYNGQEIFTYKVCDTTTPINKCDTATITINVGTTNSNGCYPNQVYTVSSEGSLDSLNSSTSVAFAGTVATTLAEAVLGDANGAEGYGEFNNAGDILTVGFPESISANDTIIVSWRTASGSMTLTTLEIQRNTVATGTFSAFGTLSTTSAIASFTTTKFVVGSGVSFRFLKFLNRGTTSPRDVYLDAVSYKKMGCISRNPVATNDAVVTLEDVPAKISVKSNDYDPAGEALTTTEITSNPSNGYVSINADGTITYINTTDVSGTDQFTYRICNISGYCATATVNITINEDGCAVGNYRPTSGSALIATIYVSNDAYISKEKVNNNYGTATKLEVGRKVSDKERKALLKFNTTSITAGSIVTSATLFLRRDGGNNNQSMAIYRGLQNWDEGTTTWTNYSDPPGASVFPWATAGAFNRTSDYTTTDSSLIGSGPTNNVWVSASVTNLTQYWVNNSASNYGLILDRINNPTEDRKFVFRSFDHTSGTANDPYLVVNYLTLAACQAITNRAPLAKTDLRTATYPNNTTITVLSNDIDPDGNSISLGTIIGTPTSGSASVSGNNVVFTPASGFNGVAIVMYTVTDGSLLDTGIIRITCLNAAPIANRDTIMLFSGATRVKTITTNDIDPELAINGSNGHVVSISRSPKNGSASVSGFNISYTSDFGFTGNDTIIYLLSESSAGCTIGQSDTAIIIVTVVNRKPNATPDSKTVFACQPGFIKVLNNDNDPEGGTLVLTLHSNPVNGTATIVGDEIVYMSTPGISTSITNDTFSYKICDNGIPSLCSTALVTMTINHSPINTKPIANRDTIFTLMEQVYYEPIKDNDFDPDGNEIKVFVNSGIMQPLHGTVNILSNGLAQYLPSDNYIGRDSFEYIIKDTFPSLGVGCPTISVKFDTAVVTVFIDINPAILLTISGTIFHDVNGLTDDTVNGNGFDNPDGDQLYAYLVNGSNIIIDSVIVNVNGTYRLDQAEAGITYTVKISTTQAGIGSTAPSNSNIDILWHHVGETYGVGNNAGSGNEAGTPNGIITVTPTTNTNITTVDFGLEIEPISNDITQAPVNNPGGTNTVQVPTLIGSDLEDGGLGSGSTIVIKTLPSNGTLYYNGIAVTAGQVITNYNPALLTVDPGFSGADTVKFTYVFRDAAGVEDATAATTAIPFGGAIGGYLYDDADGLTDNTVDGTGDGTPNAVQMYVYLVNGSNVVVDSAVIAANGIYNFTNVAPDNYTVKISSIAIAIGSPAPSVVVPTDWVLTGENIGAGAGNDGAINGILAVTMGASEVTDVNFGIDERPMSDNITASPSVNPGGTNTVQVPNITGTDLEDGTLGYSDTIVIKSLPSNANLYYNNIAITLGQVIPNYNPLLLTVDPTFNGVGTVSFTYVFKDAANAEDLSEATVTMPFAELTVAGNAYHDYTGLANGIIDGPGIAILESSRIIAYLINNTGTIVDSAWVTPSTGAFILHNANANSTYSVVISTAQFTIGAVGPTSLVYPANWTNVGESFGVNNGAGTGIESGIANGVLALNTVTSNVTAIEFSIEKSPIAWNKTFTVDPDSVLGLTGRLDYTHFIYTNFLNGTTDSTFTSPASTIMPGKVAGRDLEEGYYDGLSGANADTIIITDLPDSAYTMLVYNVSGVDVLLIPNPVSGDPSFQLWDAANNRYQIANFDASKLAFFFKMNYQLADTFKFAYKDTAGIMGNIATYILSYTVPLPIWITAFSCITSADGVQLNWKISDVKELKELKLLHSQNGVLFNPIYNAKEFSLGSNTFAYTHTKPDEGTNIYRIDAVDMNDIRIASDLCITSYNHMNSDLNIVLMPNPTLGKAYLTFNTSENVNFFIELYDLKGRKLSTEYIEVNNQIAVHTLDVSNYAEGIYNVKITWHGKTKVFRLLKN